MGTSLTAGDGRGTSSLKDTEWTQAEDSDLWEMRSPLSSGMAIWGIPPRIRILRTERYKGEKLSCCWKTRRFESRGDGMHGPV